VSIVATASSQARNSGERDAVSSVISAVRRADNWVRSAIDRSIRRLGSRSMTVTGSEHLPVNIYSKTPEGQ